MDIKALPKKLLNYISFRFKKQGSYHNRTVEAQFLSLSPTDDADKENVYIGALAWAIKNRGEKDINNIALTGPYGSGKSSIIKTFQTRNADTSLHFLNISLGTFKEELEKKTSDPPEIDEKTKKRNEVLRLIEISILQQIFYQEKPENIPDSRFLKIQSLSPQKIRNLTFLIVSVAISLIFIYSGDSLLSSLLNINLSFETIILLNRLTFLFLLVASVYLIKKTIRLFQNFRINKLNIAETGIEFGDISNKSILNQNLEEILYFFEVRPYNVVFIEDLDRFQQTEVFTKLRELNFLINKTKEKDKRVVFVYAVRDEMFRDHERTKFFDFIIPIIPHVNSSNSENLLLNHLGHEIKSSLIEDLSLFLDDMRLIFNIVNEYNIYKSNLNQNLDKNKLLAIVVYKNMFPEDFVNLGKNEGDLFNAITSKQTLVQLKIQEVKTKIEKLKNEIKTIETFRIKDIKDLRSIYVLKYVSALKNFTAFRHSNVNHDIESALTDDVFSLFVTNQMQAHVLHQPNPHNSYYNIVQTNLPSFSEIESKVSSIISYKEAEQLIQSSIGKRIEDLRAQIEKLENQIPFISSIKLMTLMQQPGFNLPIDLPNNRLIPILLRNGYIAEDYLDYISIFHEGSISKTDNTFLINTKTQNMTDFDYKLNHISNLLKKIPSSDFESPYILNFDLIDFLINGAGYNSQKKLLFEQLANNSETSLNFIIRYIDRELNMQIFISHLCKEWNEFWKYINEASQFTEDKKIRYLRLILNCGALADIVFLNQYSNLETYISNVDDLHKLCDNDQKGCEIIKQFDIKFTNLQLSRTSENIFDFVYTGNYYKLSAPMLQFILQGKNAYNETTFLTQNYGSILKSGFPYLIDYVNDNINTYLTDVYFILPENNQEEEGTYIELLKNKQVSVENKNRLIEIIVTKIHEIDPEINDYNEILFAKSKIIPSWKAILNHFVNSGNVFSAGLNSYLNIELASQDKNILGFAEVDIDPQIKTAFTEALLLNNNLSADVYVKLVNSVTSTTLEFDFSGLDKRKIALLIVTNKIGFSVNNYNLLKTHFTPLHISYLVKYIQDYLKSPSDYALEESDIVLLTKDDTTTSSNKVALLVAKGNDFVINSSMALKTIANLISGDPKIDVPTEILKAILESKDLNEIQRANLLEQKISHFNDEDIKGITDSINLELLNEADEVEVENSASNIKLATILKEKKLIENFSSSKNKLKIKHLSPPPQPILEILSAVYKGDNNEIDVTEIVRQKISDDKLTITANNELFGDPEPGNGKRLIIHYRIGQKTAQSETFEGTTLTIPEEIDNKSV